jgi:hypothetical protein
LEQALRFKLLLAAPWLCLLFGCNPRRDDGKHQLATEVKT